MSTISPYVHLPQRFVQTIFVALLLVVTAAGADNGKKNFDLPGGSAPEILKRFAKQAGREIIFSDEVVGAVKTNTVRGEFTPKEALDLLLADTGLAASQDDKTGAFAVRRGMPDPNGARVASTRSQDDRPVETSGSKAKDDIVVLSPFEVRASEDKGYHAANSVSATRVAVQIKDLPMNITALTDEFIRDQTSYDLYDVVKWAGVHQDNVSQSGWVRWNLRGFTNTAIQRNGITTNFRFLDPANIERIEVVNGPASLLYGQLNPGGIINYITKRPRSRQETTLSVAGGSHAYNRFMLDATGPVPGTGGKLLYRAVAMRENISRFSQHAKGQKQTLSAALSWRPTPRVTFNAEFEEFRRDEPNTPSSLLIVYVNGVATLPYAGLPRNFSFTALGDWQEYTSRVMSADLSVALTDAIQFRVALEQSDFLQEDRITGQAGTGILSQSVIDQFYPPGTLTPKDAMFRRNRYDLQDGDERTGQVELTGRFEFAGIRLNPLVGYRKNFNTDTHNIFKTNTTPAPWDMRNPATWNRIVPFGLEALNLNSDSSSFADNDSYYGVMTGSAFDEKLHVLAGYGRYNVHSSPARNNITGTLTSPDSARSANVPQFGALVRLTPEVSAFASYSESFLANTAFLRVNSDVRTLPAKPSVGKGYEGGLKVELMNGRVSGTITYFSMKVNPTAVFEVFGGTAPDGRMLFTDVQGGSQKSSGIDANALVTLVPGAQIYINYNRIKAVYTEHPTNVGFNGSRLVGTPDESLNIWGKYTFESGRWKGFYFGGGVSRVGNFVSQASNPLVSRMPGYTTFDAIIGYNLKLFEHRWKVDVTVRNLADKFYYASASSFGLPRHGVVTLSTKF
ncbi:MAG: Ferripyoverdine receptor precursor [Verrucomicrobiota bacterium]|jgi:iron complex outermembrane receptor protein